ncbi:toll-like receptor 2 type-1, partial [Pundamilia nyererei]|uniref:Toll-like receptor 2 type-1 n=1 Tax=Pundamilia nyererei TaxID=303518 RepID=A0A9Y3VW65_9CICH
RCYYLPGNGLAEIHPSAFDSLWSLEQLDLSYNQLTMLNHKWFSKLEALQQSSVFVMPCLTSHLLKNLQYLDLSDNLLTDLTLVETLCGTTQTLKDIRVLNFSGNALKSLSTVSRLVTKFSKLTHLDISRTGYSFMPSSCPWPSTLRFLNISGAKFTAITPCLPQTLEVLDLSNNNLKDFTLLLPVLRELYLSGNKFLRLPSGLSFPNLQTLTIQSNTLNMFGKTDLQSYQRLDNLQAGQNKFVCSCDFVSFVQLNFVQSDWCRYELDFSHFWLFDGQATGEAAILILLEPLSKDDVPKRFYKLRKLMSSTTYLEWPQEEEKREEFWSSLRNALRGNDN